MGEKWRSCTGNGRKMRKMTLNPLSSCFFMFAFSHILSLCFLFFMLILAIFASINHYILCFFLSHKTLYIVLLFNIFQCNLVVFVLIKLLYVVVTTIMIKNFEKIFKNHLTSIQKYVIIFVEKKKGGKNNARDEGQIQTTI